MSDKKKLQLGMNPSTAGHRLTKDLLWAFIRDAGRDTCCKCGNVMTRETFSIEHIVPWLDSSDPVGLFFDLDNISFSHLTCNVGSRRRDAVVCGTTTKYAQGCRCTACCSARSEVRARYYRKAGK